MLASNLIALLLLHAPLADARTAAPALDLKKLDAVAKQFFEARPRTHFSEWDPATRQKLIDEVVKLGPLPEGATKDVVEHLFKVAKKVIPPFKSTEFDTPWGKASWIAKPAAGAKAKGLIIGLHGGGEGAGDAHECLIYHRKDCEGIYPQGIRLVHDTWNTVHGERFVLTLIEDAKLHDDVDPDRVYVTGFSMGGTGSWFFAGRHPDLFAAAAPGPGVFMADPKSQLQTKEEVKALQHGFLPNVRNLPLSFYIGTADKNTMPGTYLYAWDRLQEIKAQDQSGYQELEFRVFEGMAHAFPPGEPERCLEFLGKHVRKPFPDKVVWEYASNPYPRPEGSDPQSRQVQHQFYWLRCDKPEDAMRIVAVKKGNEFDITFERSPPESLTILLNEQMIDVKQDVIVRLKEREVFHGKPTPELTTVFDSIDENLDKRLVYDRFVTIKN
jgi:hypothetical protein